MYIETMKVFAPATVLIPSGFCYKQYEHKAGDCVAPSYIWYYKDPTHGYKWEPFLWGTVLKTSKLKF